MTSPASAHPLLLVLPLATLYVGGMTKTDLLSTALELVRAISDHQPPGDLADVITHMRGVRDAFKGVNGAAMSKRVKP